MKVNMYSVKDRIADDFTQPWQSKNEDTAARAFITASNGKDNKEDFELYYVGVFDTSQGIFIPIKKPIFVIDVPLIKTHGEEQNA